MTAEQFAYWLKGFTELNDAAMPTEAQWLSINDHLKAVFWKVTPDRTTTLRDLSFNPITTITC